MIENPGPGRLIAVEGLDGSGKSTQLRLLSQRLGRTRSVSTTYEPTDGPIGLQIRMVLEHRVKVSAPTLAALFAADRTDHIYRPESGILASLQRDIDVLTDRYYLSSFAYQGMSVDWTWIEEMHAFCIRPELICFVDVPIEVCLARIAARSTREKGGQADLFENCELLTRARESHLTAIERLREQGDRISIVDGNASADLVHERLWRAVQPALEARQPG